MGLSAIMSLYVCFNKINQQLIMITKRYKNDASLGMILTWSTFIEEWKGANHNSNTEKDTQAESFCTFIFTTQFNHEKYILATVSSVTQDKFHK